MIAATHFSFAAVLWYFFTVGISVEFLSYGTLCFLALGALMPDIDEPRSTIGRVLFPISWGIRIFLHWGHRQQTHSFLGLFFFALLMFPLFFAEPAWWLAFSFGYLSHLVSDMMTKSGVPLFWPSRTFYYFPGDANYRIKTGSVSEWVLLGILTVILSHAIGITRPGVNATMRFVKGSVLSFAQSGEEQTLGIVEQTIELDNLNQLMIKTGDVVQLGQVLATTAASADDNSVDFLEEKIARGNFAITNRATVQALTADLKSAETHTADLANFREQEIRNEIDELNQKIATQQALSEQSQKKAKSYQLEAKTLSDRYDAKIEKCNGEVTSVENEITATKTADGIANKKKELETRISFLKREITEKRAAGKSTLTAERNLELARLDLEVLNTGEAPTASLEHELETTQEKCEALALERENKIAELQHKQDSVDESKAGREISALLAEIEKLELEIQKVPAEIETARVKETSLKNRRGLEWKKVVAEKEELESDLTALRDKNAPKEIRASFAAEVRKISLENSTVGKVKIKILFSVLDEPLPES